MLALFRKYYHSPQKADALYLAKHRVKSASTHVGSQPMVIDVTAAAQAARRKAMRESFGEPGGVPDEGAVESGDA